MTIIRKFVEKQNSYYISHTYQQVRNKIVTNNIFYTFKVVSLHWKFSNNLQLHGCSTNKQ